MTCHRWTTAGRADAADRCDCRLAEWAGEGSDAVKRIPTWVSYLTIAGNLVYILWIVRNGIDEAFRSTAVELVSMTGLIVLLGLNALLLWDARRDRSGPNG